MAKLHQIGSTEIRVYSNDHLPPHFHVLGTDFEALIEIATFEIMKGTLPKGRTRRTIIKWATDNKDKIIAEWNRVNRIKFAE